MPIPLREIRYWLVRNSNRKNCWIVLNKLDNMLSHPSKICLNSKREVIPEEDITLSSTTLKYVYSVHLTQQDLLALVEGKDAIYLLKNRNNEGSTVKGELTGAPNSDLDPIESTIIKCSNLTEAIDMILTKSERALLGIKKTHKMDFKKGDSEKLKEILPIDFIDLAANKEGILQLWNKLLDTKSKQEGKKSQVLDFSAFFNITEDVLHGSDQQYAQNIKEMVFSQNIQLNNFHWMTRFSNLRTLGFWFCYQLKNEHIELICKYVPNLDSINLHSCFQINNRVLLPLLLRSSVTKICLDNRVLVCQNNPYQGVITNKEWETLTNHKLEYLYINSDNLTNDVIDKILNSCLALKKFLMNTLVLKRLRENLEEGLGPETVIFQSCDDLKLGFRGKRDFKIKNLLSQQYEETFSESMKQLMQKEENSNDDSEGTLEKELIKEVEEEFRDKFGDAWVEGLSSSSA